MIMNVSGKREQGQIYLSFAEREERLMIMNVYENKNPVHDVCHGN